MENKRYLSEKGVMTLEESNKVRALFNAIYPSHKFYIENNAEKEFEIANFLRLGFTPYFSFYGENNLLNPSVSWYGFYGKKSGSEEYLNLVICANSSKTEYTVYKDNRKIGVFNDLEDILSLFNVKQYIPEFPSLYTDFLLFEKDRLGEILKKAKKLMDDEKWNNMVEEAAKLNNNKEYYTLHEKEIVERLFDEEMFNTNGSKTNISPLNIENSPKLSVEEEK